MIRVGIITIHKLNNYGSVLQAYALQSMVSSLGCWVDIIDYSIQHTPAVLFGYAVQAYREVGLLQTVSSIAHYGIALIQEIREEIIRQDSHCVPIPDIFDEFRKTRLVLSNESYSPETLRSTPPDYDVYITGSDNVWLINNAFGISDGGARFYLDFVSENKKTISYAPSMGDPSISEKYQNRFKSLLKNIDYLSVRESSTAEFITEMTGVSAATVCDPTLLLTREEWDTLIPCETIVSSSTPYILVYVIHALDADSDAYVFAHDLAKKQGLDILYIGYHFVQGKPIFTTVSVSEFLQSFKNASYVITNTFHGTMFSIIYRKVFYAFKPRAGPARIRDVLATVGLSDRFVESESEARELPADVNYHDAEAKIQKFRSDSLLWLQTALQDGDVDIHGEPK